MHVLSVLFSQLPVPRGIRRVSLTLIMAKLLLSLLVASTSFHAAHNLIGKVMGLMQARMQMDSASDKVRRPGSLSKQREAFVNVILGRVHIMRVFSRFVLVVDCMTTAPKPCCQHLRCTGCKEAHAKVRFTVLFQENFSTSSKIVQSFVP